MATLIMYESDSGDILYECSNCLEPYMKEKLQECPTCGVKFTKFVDEVEITHNHRMALKAAQNDPNNSNKKRELLWWALKRALIEHAGE